MSETNKRKSYDIDFKLEAVEFSKKHSKEAAARHFKVDPKRIREWCKQEEKLKELKQNVMKQSKRKRLHGGGGKMYSEELEERLMAWIEGQRSNNLRVSRSIIIRKAKEMTENGELSDCSRDKPFKASKGWLDRFMHRNQIITFLTPHQIERSFKSCVVKVEPDCKDDDQITCLKPGHEAQGGRTILLNRRNDSATPESQADLDIPDEHRTEMNEIRPTIDDDYCVVKEEDDYCVVKEEEDYCVVKEEEDYCVVKEEDDYCVVKEEDDHCVVNEEEDYCVVKEEYDYCVVKEEDDYCAAKEEEVDVNVD